MSSTTPQSGSEPSNYLTRDDFLSLPDDEIELAIWHSLEAWVFEPDPGEARDEVFLEQCIAQAKAEIADPELLQVIIENLPAVCSSPSFFDPDPEIRKMPVGARMLWLTWQVENEVSNGGFDQYFLNTEGCFALEALDGFRLVGAMQFADLLHRAIVVYARKKHSYDIAPRLIEYAQAFEAKRESFNKLDKLFYALWDEEDLSGLRVQYIRNHPDEFDVTTFSR